jgi:hypothetical protein
LQTYSSYSVWWLVMGISRCFKAKKLWPSNRSITIPIFNQSDHRPTFNIPNFHRLCQGLGRWFCPPIIGNSQGQTVSCGVWSHDIPIKLIKTMIIWWLNPIKSPWSLKWYTQWYQPFFRGGDINLGTFLCHVQLSGIGTNKVLLFKSSTRR